MYEDWWRFWNDFPWRYRIKSLARVSGLYRSIFKVPLLMTITYCRSFTLCFPTIRFKPWTISNARYDVDHILWHISYGPYHMVHIIWKILNSSYNRDHIISFISYGPYHMETISYSNHKPYQMHDIIWTISYGTYHMVHFIWKILNSSYNMDHIIWFISYRKY